MLDWSFLYPPSQQPMNEQLPGALGSTDPYGTAAALGAPVPASGEFRVTPPERYGTVPAIYAESSSLPPQAKVPANGGQPPSLPDMRGIEDALARNEALGAEQSQGRKSGVGDFLLAWAGHLGDNLTGNPAYSNSLKHRWQLEQIDREAERKARLPQQVGGSLIAPDGQGGYRTLFRDPSTPEAYALAQGFQPSTPEYAEAVRQYRLGSWSDEAVQAKTGLTGYRYDRMGDLQEDRQDFSRGMQEDRQSHSDYQLGQRLGVTRRAQDMTDSRVRRGQNLTDKRVRGSAGYRGRGGKPQPGGMVQVKSLEEARRLPVGTVFQTPDGRIKVR
jgi:hypothetical protein